jgi:hypothetical protein
LHRPIPADHNDHDLIEVIRTIYEDYRGRQIVVAEVGGGGGGGVNSDSGGRGGWWLRRGC